MDSMIQIFFNFKKNKNNLFIIKFYFFSIIKIVYRMRDVKNKIQHFVLLYLICICVNNKFQKYTCYKSEKKVFTNNYVTIM